MVGTQKYTDAQILFVLGLHAEGTSREKIRAQYAEKFDEPKFSAKKAQYVIENFSRDPRSVFVPPPPSPPLGRPPSLPHPVKRYVFIYS